MDEVLAVACLLVSSSVTSGWIVDVDAAPLWVARSVSVIHDHDVCPPLEQATTVRSVGKVIDF